MTHMIYIILKLNLFEETSKKINFFLLSNKNLCIASFAIRKISG